MVLKMWWVMRNQCRADNERMLMSSFSYSRWWSVNREHTVRYYITAWVDYLWNSSYSLAKPARGSCHSISVTGWTFANSKIYNMTIFTWSEGFTTFQKLFRQLNELRKSVFFTAEAGCTLQLLIDAQVPWCARGGKEAGVSAGSFVEIRWGNEQTQLYCIVVLDPVLLRNYDQVILN